MYKIIQDFISKASYNIESQNVQKSTHFLKSGEDSTQIE